MTDPTTTNTPPGTAGYRYTCSKCEYNLVGVRIGDPCPECGELFLVTTPSEQRIGAAVASLVLGMMSIVTCMFYGLPGIICGILAIVYSKKAREAVQAGNAPAFSLDFARAGKICGWVGISLAALMFALIVLYMIMVIGFLGAAFGGGGGAFPAPTPAPLPAAP